MSDPETGLSLIGNTEHSDEHKGKTFVTKVTVNAPSGVIVEFGKNGAHVNKAGVTEKITGHGELDGFEYEEHLTLDHERTVLTFSDGPTFELVQTFATGSYSVKVTDQTGISSKAKGIFGVFMEDDSYHIVNHNLEDDVGMVVTSKKSVPAVRKGSFQNNC